MPGDFAKSFDFTSDEVNECFDGILEGGPRLIPVEIFEQMRACCLANAADSDAQPAQAAQYPPDWPNGPDREPAQAAQWPAELKAIGFEDAASVIGYLDDIDSEVARITGDEGEDSSLEVLKRMPSQAAQPWTEAEKAHMKAAAELVAEREALAQPVGVPLPQEYALPGTWGSHGTGTVTAIRVNDQMFIPTNEDGGVYLDRTAAAQFFGLQPVGVPDGYKHIGWVHPVYLDQHIDAGALAIEVSQPRLSDAQVPVFVRAAAPQPAPSADAEDAARYRWLRPRLLTADFEYGDDSETVLVFLIPTTMAVSANLDKSIDAARAAEGGE